MAWQLLVAVALLSGGAAGCGTKGHAPQPELEALWRDYSALPEERALAIAGELRRNQWVAGASGGHATRSEAERAALRECGKRKAERSMVEACRLYMVGDERVVKDDAPN